MNSAIVKALIFQLEDYLKTKEDLENELKKKKENMQKIIDDQRFFYLSILKDKETVDDLQKKALETNQLTMKLSEETTLVALDVEYVENEIKSNNDKKLKAHKSIVRILERILLNKKVQLIPNNEIEETHQIICHQLFEADMDKRFFGVVDDQGKTYFIGNNIDSWTFDEIIEE